jgi:tetratricopeptide (TPR) repeat protein
LAERTDADNLVIALNGLPAAYLFQGQLARAKHYAERALAVAERRQVPADIASQRVGLGDPAHFQGDWAEAREHFTQAVAIQERLDPTFTWYLSACAPVYLRLLDLAEGHEPEESMRRLEPLLASMRGRAIPAHLQMGALGNVALAERQLLAGQAAAARARLAAFVDQPGLAEHVRMTDARMAALPALAWAEAELGHHAEAAERLEPAITWATARRWHLWLVDALRVMGLLAARQRRWEDARALLEEAIALCRAMPYPYAEAKALYVYGQLHAAKGEPEQAHEQYQAAISICARLGEGLYRPHIERALAYLERDGGT